MRGGALIGDDRERVLLTWTTRGACVRRDARTSPRHHLRPLLRPAAGGDCGGAHLGPARRRGAEGADRQNSRAAPGGLCPRARSRVRRNDRRGAGAVVPRAAQRDRRGHGRAAIARRPRGGRRDACRPRRPRRFASGRGRRIHPPRLRERQARSHRRRRSRRPGDGGNRRPAAASLSADDAARLATAPKPGGRS